MSSSNQTENADVVCSNCEQVESEANNHQSENVAKNDNHSKELSRKESVSVKYR